MSLIRSSIVSPIDPINYLIFEDHLVGVAMAGQMDGLLAHLRRHGPAELKHAAVEERKRGAFDTQFRAYFKGNLAALNEIPIRLYGTDFQKRVWRQLDKVPAGKTATYGQIARRIKKPQAVRAVGLANGRNPISLRVPCHRVIGADGSLTGYGGGLDRKRWLLRHEQAQD